MQARDNDQQQQQQQQQQLSDSAQRLTKGLGRFVKQIVNMYKSGFDSQSMLLQQSLAGVQGQSDGKGSSPSVITMQQNTRLVVLTLEVNAQVNTVQQITVLELLSLTDS